MEIRIEYSLYNNKDFKQTVFCATMEEAIDLKTRLEKIRHVSEVEIKEAKR